MLEMISASDRLGDIVIAPSFLIKDMWEGIMQNDLTRNFNYFFELSMNNLGEPEEGAKQHCSTKWNITADNLDAELERTNSDNISFYFILRWLGNELRRMHTKKIAPGTGPLLSCLVDKDKPEAKLLKPDEILAMCYIQYLEST